MRGVLLVFFLINNLLHAQVQPCDKAISQLPGIEERAVKGEWETALSLCNTAMKSCPDRGEFLLLRADLFLKLDNIDSAEIDLRRYIFLFPNEGTGFRKMAGLHYFIGGIDSSLHYLDRALKINAADTIALYNKGEVWFGERELDKAEKQYLHLLKIAPDHLAARLRLCDIWISQDKTSACREQLEIMQRNHAQNLDVILTDAMLLIREEHFDRAAVVLDNAQRIDSTEKAIYFTRALLYERTNKYSEALRQYNKIITIDPDDANAYFERGNLLIEMDQFELAIADYKDVLSIDTSFADAWHQIGIALYELSDYEGSVKAIDEYLKRNPEDAEAWFNRGNGKYAHQDYSDALIDYNEALNREENSDYRYNRAICHYALGNPSAAIRDLDEYLLKESADAEGYYLRCLCHLEIQQFEDGCSDCEMARKMGKKDIPKNINKICNGKHRKKRK